MTPAVVLIIGAFIASAACGRTDDSLAAGGGGAVRADWGVVLPEEEQAKLLTACSRPTPPGLTGRWSPGRADIDRLERRLPSVLQAALARVVLEKDEARPLPADYYRQYGAFHRGGRRVIYVNGLHRRFVDMRESRSWTRNPMGLCDGGLIGFGVVYDVDADTFDGVEFDGRYSGPVKTRWF